MTGTRKAGTTAAGVGVVAAATAAAGDALVFWLAVGAPGVLDVSGIGVGSTATGTGVGSGAMALDGADTGRGV